MEYKNLSFEDKCLLKEISHDCPTIIPCVFMIIGLIIGFIFLLTTGSIHTNEINFGLIIYIIGSLCVIIYQFYHIKHCKYSILCNKFGKSKVDCWILEFDKIAYDKEYFIPSDFIKNIEKDKFENE